MAPDTHEITVKEELQRFAEILNNGGRIMINASESYGSRFEDGWGNIEVNTEFLP